MGLSSPKTPRLHAPSSVSDYSPSLLMPPGLYLYYIFKAPTDLYYTVGLHGSSALG